MTDFPVRFLPSGRLRELLDRYCEGSLDEADGRELQEWLLRDEAAREFFVSYLAVDSGLRWECRRGALNALSTENHERELTGPPWRTSPFRLRFFVAALSVLLLGTAFLWQRALVPPEPQAPGHAVKDSPRELPKPFVRDEKNGDAQNLIVATLTDLSADVVVERMGQPRRAAAGMEIVANDALRVPFGGSALVKLTNAARIQLGSRSVLSFQHEGRPELREGFAEVDATENLHRLAWSLRTATADTEIHSSRFAVGAGPKLTHVRVAAGSVSVQRRRDGATLDVGQGFSSTVADDVDLQPMSSRYGTALLVISSSEIREGWTKFNRLVGDRLIGDRLWRSALSVKVRTLDELTPNDLKNCAVIVVSLFNFGDDEKRFLLSGISDLAVPVICLEPAGFPILGMTGSEIGKDYHFQIDTVNLIIARPDHPLAAGYRGPDVDLITAGKRILGWAQPGGASQKIVHIEGEPDRWVLFAFDKGEAMFNRMAPERRVGLFLSPDALEEGSSDLKLIDAAIQWCVETESTGI